MVLMQLMRHAVAHPATCAARRLTPRSAQFGNASVTVTLMKSLGGRLSRRARSLLEQRKDTTLIDIEPRVATSESRV